MITATLPKTRNVKAAFKFCVASYPQNKVKIAIQEKCALGECKVTNYHNFSVVRGKYIFSIFWNGYVNVTKIPNEDLVVDAIRYVCGLMKVLHRNFVINPHIQNICSSGVLSSRIDIRSVHSSVKSFGVVSTLNTCYFPALFYKAQGLGTVVLFQNGKYSVLGAKSVSDVHKIISGLCHHINKQNEL